jgi:hypothetical protein
MSTTSLAEATKPVHKLINPKAHPPEMRAWVWVNPMALLKDVGRAKVPVNIKGKLSLST